MKMCMPHWNRLRDAIDQRGLSALVSDTGEQAAKNLVSELEDGPSIDNFDPLMGAHNAIMSNALATAGTALFDKKPDGSDWCPLCFLIEVVAPDHAERCQEADCPGTPNFETWVDRAADDQVAAWKALGAG